MQKEAGAPLWVRTLLSEWSGVLGAMVPVSTVPRVQK